MKLLTVCLLFLISGNLRGQINNFKLYQHNINNAELSLIKGNKVEALDIYYTTLMRSEGNFSKDIYNALLLSKELNKTESFFIFLNLLTKKGLNNSYINEFKDFEQFHKHKKWDAFLKVNQNYAALNESLRSDIDSLHIKDQFFRTKEGAYKVYGDTIKQIDSLNMLYLYSLIARDKFPGEDEIGVRNIWGQQGYDIVLHHYTQSVSENKKLKNIDPLLINLVQQGKILPNKCAHWLEMQNGVFKAGVFDITGFKIAGKHVGYFRPAYSKVQKLIIDEYRKLLYLESLEDYYKKFTYVIQNPDSKYNFDIRLYNFEVDEKGFSIWSKNMVEIK